MKTILSSLLIFLTTTCIWAQVPTYKYTPKKYTPVQNSKTNTMINTMSKSNQKYTKKYNKNNFSKEALKINSKEYLANMNRYKTFKNIDNGNVSGRAELMGISSSTNFYPKIKSTPRNIKKNGNCVTQDISLESIQMDIGTFAGNGKKPFWVVPGSIFESKEILGVNPKPASFKRKPIVLSAVGNRRMNLTESVTVTGSDEKNKITSGIGRLINSFKNVKVPADISFEYEEVKSIEEVEVNVNGTFTGFFGLGKFASELNTNYKNSRENRYYMINVKQYLYSIEAENSIYEKTDFILDKGIDRNNYVYISRVDYGRRVLVLIKTNKNLEEISGDLEASLTTMLTNSKLKTDFKTLTNREDFWIKGYFYGGDSDAAVESLLSSIEDGKANIKSYLTKLASSPDLGVPISYNLRSLGGYDVAIKTNLNRKNLEVCLPVEGQFNLTVKLEDFYCTESDDSDDTDDYAFNQSVVFKINGNYKKGKEQRQLYSSYKPRSAKSTDNYLMTGSKSRQIAVKEGNYRSIDHCVHFTISPEEYQKIKKGDYSFEIINNLYEFSDMVAVMANNKKINVDVNKVIENLVGINDLPDRKGYKGGWKDYNKFGNSFKLRKYDKQNSTDIYGYINFKSGDRKARAKMRFRLSNPDNQSCN